MMLLNYFKARKFQWTFAIALFATLVVPTTADAQTSWNCQAGGTQSGGVVTCTANGGSGGNDGGSGGHQADHSWTVIAEYPNEPCIDQYGVPSYYVDIVQQSTGAVILHHCTTQNTTGSAPTIPTNEQLQAQAATIVVNPVVDADFKGDFLTGAPITFSAGVAQVATQPVPGVPGAYLEATASTVTWDFGDGTSATGLNPPPKTYQSTSPNPANPDNHTVSVKVTTTWDLRFHQQAADGSDAVINLAPITLSGTLNPDPRTIVQVWSAQTEPR